MYFVRKETNTNPIFFKTMTSNTKVLIDELEIENNNYMFEQNKLKIKLLKSNDGYDIRNINSKYEININKNITHYNIIS